MQALSDFMIAHPQARAYEAAKFFNVTEAWLSTVKNSDAFVQFHNTRREDHFERISEGVGDKLQTLAEISLDEMTERLEQEREQLSLDALQNVGKMAIGALGFGGRNAVNVQVNQDNRSVIVNDSAALARSRERLKQIRAQNDKAILSERIVEVEEAEAVGNA